MQSIVCLFRTAKRANYAAALVAVLWTGAYAAPAAYVSNLVTGTISVIDTETNAVLTTLQIGPYNGAIAVSPSGGQAFMLNGHIDGSNEVVVIDTATNAASGNAISLSGTWNSLASNLRGDRVYVTEGTSDTPGSHVFVLDTIARTQITSITVGSNPLGVIVSPSGQRIYVANNNDGSVSIIDAATNTVDGLPITVSGHPRALALSPNGARLYATNSNNKVYVIDTVARNVLTSVAVNSPLGIAIDPSGARAYVADSADGAIVVIDMATNLVVGSPITVGSGPLAVAVNTTGTRVFVCNFAGTTVSAIDTVTNMVIGDPIPVGSTPGYYGVFIASGAIFADGFDSL